MTKTKTQKLRAKLAKAPAKKVAKAVKKVEAKILSAPVVVKGSGDYRPTRFARIRGKGDYASTLGESAVWSVPLVILAPLSSQQFPETEIIGRELVPFMRP